MTMKIPQLPVVTLTDGYNGHTAAFFFVDPVEVDGETVKLRCADPDKTYMSAWRSMSEVKTALASQDEDRKLVPTPDVVHSGWLANLKEGDQVEVPYSLAKEDIKLMTVFENDGVWIRLLQDGFSKLIDNTVLVDAVSGVLHYASARIVPPGTTNGKMEKSRGHLAYERDLAAQPNYDD
jgi:hypothetical protein